MKVDITIVGGGAAGLAAAINAYHEGLNVLVVEREKTLGGILNQCIHNGFGLHVFKEELTGPEYATRFKNLFLEKDINFLLDTTVLDIEKKDDFVIKVSSEADGLYEIESKSVILSTGCYERTRGQIRLPGDRPAGIMPAGSAQRYLNIEGYLVGKNIFILGSGDIGLIMARRMTLEGANVLGVAEIMPHSNGLTRNIVQCLDDFNIPLYLSHTVTDIVGKSRLEQITISEVDQEFKPILGTEKVFNVDTLLLSVGLIPDVALFDKLNIEISPITKSAYVNQHYETNIDGLFVCGNALHVHDLVDWVSKESERAGHFAKSYVLANHRKERNEKEIICGNLVRYVVPQRLDFEMLDEPIDLSFRITKKVTQGTFKILQDGIVIKEKKAKYLAPAEMEKISLNPKDLISKSPLTLMLEVTEA